MIALKDESLIVLAAEPVGSSCEGSDCCTTTESGAAACSLPQTRPPAAEARSRWQSIRGGLMFGLACITSPCCTPLIVPLVLALLAGTPAALWISHNLGWVYGSLTIVSVVSVAMGWRWMNIPKRRAL
jgi:hypothetical protein